MTKDRSRPARSAITAALAVMLVVSACGPTASASPSGAPPSAASPDVASPDVGSPAASPSGSASASASGSPSGSPALTGTLRIWDQEVREALGPVVEELNAEFEAANPGVTIERESKSFDDLKATVKTALADTNGPDVAQVNQGRGDMGAAVEAGLLLPLTEHAERFGWNERWGEGVLARNSFTDDGRTFGSGTLYGISMTGEIVGMFYNKEKLAALNLQPPRAFPELVDQLTAIMDAGETPIAFGNLDGDALQIYGSILETLVDREWLDAWIYGVDDASFDIPEATQAAETLLDFADSGYFTEGYEGIGYDDSWRAFAGGDGVFFWTGSWIGGDLVGAGGEKFGFIRTPPQTAGGASLSIGGVGLPWAIRKTTGNPELALAYIDFMTSDAAMEKIAAAGVLPSHGDPPGNGELFNEMKAAFADANEKDEVGHYLDWAAPTLFDLFKAEIPKMLAKQTTPDGFVDAINSEYESFVGSLD